MARKSGPGVMRLRGKQVCGMLLLVSKALCSNTVLHLHVLAEVPQITENIVHHVQTTLAQQPFVIPNNLSVDIHR